jgi:hypothetical protein
VIAVPCGLAPAKAAIASRHPKVENLADEMVRVDPNSAERLVCVGDTMAVALASGGTAGDVGYVLFHRTAAGWRVEKTGPGYQLGVFKLGADVQVVQPVYEKNNPNCCPTGGFDHVRWHWNGTHFVVARSWHTKSFAP